MTGMEKLTLLVDAGGTKTDWALVADGEVFRYRTGGINLSVTGKERILATVIAAADQMGDKASMVSDIRYYGAGVVGRRRIIELDAVLKNVFPGVSVAYGTDLLAAAEAGLETRTGLVCILGTGSNSGVYNGRSIVANIHPGGYVLGDEGSGSFIGKALLADYIKDRLPSGIRQKLDDAYGLSYGKIVENVYMGGNPACYLASFAPFVFSCRGDDYADSLIDSSLRSFMERSLLPYGDMEMFPAGLSGVEVAVAGSVGYECMDELKCIGKEYGLVFSRFVKNPVDELAERLSSARDSR